MPSYIALMLLVSAVVWIWEQSWSQLSLVHCQAHCWTLLRAAQRIWRFCSLGLALYAVKAFLLASMTGVISSEWASNQSADLLVFLPKTDSVVDNISEVFPSVLSICSGWARERILQHSNTRTNSSNFSLVACFAGVDAWSVLLAHTVQTLRGELHIAAHQRVVNVTIGALVAASDLDAGKVDTSGEDQVKLMPVFGSQVSPGDSMLRLCIEEGVTDAKPMMTAEL